MVFAEGVGVVTLVGLYPADAGDRVEAAIACATHGLAAKDQATGVLLSVAKGEDVADGSSTLLERVVALDLTEAVATRLCGAELDDVGHVIGVVLGVVGHTLALVAKEDRVNLPTLASLYQPRSRRMALWRRVGPRWRWLVNYSSQF